MKLTDEIYAYEWTDAFENNCNSYFIGGGRGILIDPGLKRFFPSLLERMGEDGVGEGDIRYVLNTHSHPDHFEAAELFNGNGSVTVGLNGTEKTFHEQSGKLLYGWFGLDLPRVDIGLDLQEGELVIGEEPFEVLLTPGHSPGSVCLFWPAKKALFCGDVIFHQNVGRTDFPGGSGELLKKSILRISRLDVEHLLPGHMDIVSGAGRVKENFLQVIEYVFPYL
jgi:glyoxylase-like metal-dependent hydrolase (beta-lactamase superfamily II)